MATDIQKAEVRGLLQHPPERFDLRNPELLRLWEELLKTQYFLPPTVGPVHGDQPGTASHLANMFLDIVARYPRLEVLFSYPVVLGGQGHCQFPRDNEFPMEMRCGRKHFYQHGLDGSLYDGDALIVGYACDFAYEMLTPVERAEYAKYAKPGRIKQDFDLYFQAFVKEKRAYLPEEPHRIQQIKLSILENLFQPAVLASRAPVVENFKFRKWTRLI